MGTFTWPLRISRYGRPAQVLEIEATVDTGAFLHHHSHSTAAPSWAVEPIGQAAGSSLADGRRVEMEYGRAWATIDRESVGYNRGLWRGQCSATAGSLHPGRAGAGGGPHPIAAADPRQSHNVLAMARPATACHSETPRVEESKTFHHSIAPGAAEPDVIPVTLGIAHGEPRVYPELRPKGTI